MEKKEHTKVDQFKEILKGKKAHEPPKPAEAPAVAPAEAPPPVNMEELTIQLQAAEDEAKGHYDKLLRVMAEFENFKKRMDREREEIVKFSLENFFRQLIPALDDLDRVLDHVPAEAATEVGAIADGVRLARKHILTALEKFGLTQVEDPVGKPFDPMFHEATGHIETNENPPRTVVSVHRKGWCLHSRLLRPAMVTVAKEKISTNVPNPK